MAEFFKELKALREERKIDLDEVHKRTKINIDYLKALEEGRFDILPKPYVRLFLRAYTVEVGGDPDQAVDQLEQMLAARENRPVSRPKTIETDSLEVTVDEEISLPERSPQKMRSDLTKGLILLAVFLFAIYIIRKINTESSRAVINEAGPAVVEPEPRITSNDLLHNFDRDHSNTDLINIAPPFEVKLSSIERVLYSATPDSEERQSVNLLPGDSRLHSFENELELLLNESRGISIRINGEPIPNFHDHIHPVRVHFKVDSITQIARVDYFIPKS